MPPRKALRVCKTNFDLEPHMIPFLMTSPFFAELSRHIKKLPTKDIPTAGVTHNPDTDDLILWWNPDFIAKLEAYNEKEKSRGDAKIHGLLVHEFYHLVFQHISNRRKSPPKMWNIATDAAINSIIMNPDDHGGRTCDLPDGGIIPGRMPTMPDGREMTQEEKDARPLADVIAAWPIMQASEWYFMRLKEFAQKQKDECPVHGKEAKKKKKDEEKKKKDKGDQPDGDEKSKGKEKGDDAEGDGEGDEDGKGKGKGDSGEGGDQPGDGSGGGQDGDGCTCGEGHGDPTDGFDSMDAHDIWDDLDESEREHIEARIQDAVAKATRFADQQGSNGWGSVPADIREAIRKSVSRQVSWRVVMRQFVGTLQRGERHSSIRKISRKYPYIHPGVRRGHVPNLLIAIDESGSVSMEARMLFFAELNSFSQRCTFDVVSFDTICGPIAQWRKGAQPPTVASERIHCGGTNFDAVTTVVEAPANRGRWNGVLIMTDGICNQPKNIRLKRGWILCPGCELPWPTSEMIIKLTNELPMKGAWR